ncbi:Uncharacterized protein TCM_002059 [Theobroma cacao]|uniref:RNase H type-1 domain-containing protein n=1 Tax=Theobroma cacao TaxID=3641 RepID=A0A061DKF3_THECC|nr:Uncharacterized protein TCM_002059 [Theobroma cacao]
MAELIALRHGLIIAIKYGVDYIEIEGDQSLVIQMLVRQAIPFSKICQSILADCVKYIKSFRSVKVHQIDEYSNDAANNIARIATELEETSHWDGWVPTKIANILVTDANLAHSKCENFYWQVMKGMIAVKREFLRRGFIDKNVALYHICNADIDIVEHLFIDYYGVWCVWMLWVNFWRFSWTSLKNLRDYFSIWNEAVNGRDHFLIWKLSFFTIPWMIRIQRNNLVSNGKPWDSVKLATGSLKFNVDGATRGCPSPSRIEGALRDHEGFFSQSHIELDFSNAVKWINCPFSSPWQFKCILRLIDFLIKNIKNWYIIHIPYEANYLADRLAKLAINCTSERIQVFG